MKKFALIFLLFPLLLNAQSKSLYNADSLIVHTNNSVAIAKKGGEESWGGLFCNSVEINKLHNQWRALGNYNCKINFWYSDQPAFAKFQEKKEESVLVRTDVIIEYASMTFDYEFYYADGMLFYVSSKVKEEGSTPTHLQYYFNAGVLVKYLSDGEISKLENSEDYSEILTMSNNFTALFLNMF